MLASSKPAMCGALARPSAPAVGPLLGGACAAGVCATEERRSTVPQEHPKQDFTPFRAGSAAPAWMPAVLGRGQDSPTRGTQPHFPALIFLVQQQACKCYYNRVKQRLNLSLR